MSHTTVLREEILGEESQDVSRLVVGNECVTARDLVARCLRNEPNPEKAWRAFERRHLLLFVDDCEVESLNEIIHLTRESDVTFLDLRAMIG